MASDDMAQRAVSRIKGVVVSEVVQLQALGEAATALHAAGRPVNNQTLIAHLMDPVRALAPDDLRRQRAELAAARVGWTASS